MAEKKAKPEVDNLSIYEAAREVPKHALKTIGAGRLKGFSDVNPMYRIKRMTEIFGPCGIGWSYEIDKQWTETYGNEVKAFCNVLLYVKYNGEWSRAIPGTGGSTIVEVNSKGTYVSDEGYKMALTDALSVAMKGLGVAADVYYAKDGNNLNPGDSKYRDTTDAKASSKKADDTDALMEQAVAEMSAVTSHEALQQVWAKWSKECPSICVKGSKFYEKTVEVGTKYPKAS